MDDESFRTQLGIALHAPVLEFYLEGVHCTACMWLIEKLPELCPNDLVSARLDLQSSVVELQFQENGSISNVAEMIDELGYRPHPVFSNEHKTELLQHETRSFLTKVALAGACTGNIMIFAISIYAGATGFIKDHFDWIILALSLPVFSYCAIPLYKNAWHAIRNQRWSVDIPILIALGAGFVTSVYSVFTKGSQNYLDSLSGLVFLLLASRYWLMRLQKNAFEKMQISESFYPAKILRNNCEYVWVKELVQGDVIDVLPGMRIPVDGIVIEGESHLDESILNGESKPRKITLHESVYAGTHNYDSKLKIRVDSIGENSRIGKIAKEMQSFEVSKNETVQSAERVARWFTLSVLAWTSLVFAYFLMKHEPVEGIRRVLAILIVSCPCAFALATPLALIQAFQILLKCGLYLKDPNEIEKVRDLKQVALDKTGTLTEGVLEVFNVQWMGSHAEATQKLYLDLVRVLEGDSRHPVARAMVRFTERKISAQKSFLKIRDRNEIPGYGITALWNEHEVSISRIPRVNDPLGSDVRDGQDWTESGLSIDGTLVAVFQMKDRLKDESIQLLAAFKKFGLETWILTGDQKASANAVAQKLSVKADQVKAELMPEEKAAWLREHPHTLFVGDGANDGLALCAAHLGVAAFGALDTSLKSANGYLIKNNLLAIRELLTVSHETRIILKRHLIFTVIYNFSTVGLATFGYLEPLIAAVLMPLSSVLILFSTYIGTKELRRLRWGYS